VNPPVFSPSAGNVTPSSASKAFHIPSLDGIRAISILIVFLSHAGLHKVIPGVFGVTVFFFLSGFLITTLLRIEHGQSGGINLRDFYLRRILRIFPPFYLVLAGIVILAMLGVLSSGFDWSAVTAQALHMANYQEIFGSGAQPQGTEVLWSLAVEEHFYLVFPFVYILLRRWLPDPFHQFCVLAGLAAGVLAWRFALVYGLQAVTLDPKAAFDPRICHGTDTRFDSLLFGCMLAVYGNPVLDRSRFGRGTWVWVFVPLSAATLLASFVVRDPGFRETLRYSVQGIALFALFIAAIRFPEWGIFRALNWRWVRVLGVLSYSIYLTHFAIIFAVQKWFPVAGSTTGSGRIFHIALQGVIALVLTISLSALLHHGIERPCARLRKTLSRIQGSPESRKQEQKSAQAFGLPVTNNTAFPDVSAV